MKLYEIDQEIENCVDPDTGEVVDIEKLQALELERERKISGIACWVKSLKAEAEAIKAEKDVLAKRQKVCENKVEQLKDYLMYALNGEKFKDARVSISYRKSTSTKIAEDLDLKQLPDDCKKVKIEPSLTAIREKLLAGESIEGCSLVENTSMQIR